MTKKPRPQSNPLNRKDLDCIRSFLSEIRKDVSFSARQFNTNSFWFVREGQPVFLSPEGYKKYRCVKEKILNRFPDNDLSESAIDNALGTAVFESVNIQETEKKIHPSL